MALAISNLSATSQGGSFHSTILQPAQSIQKPPFGSTAVRLIPKEETETPAEPNEKLVTLRLEREKKFQELTEQIHRDTQKKMENAAAKRDAKFQTMLQSVMNGLEGQESILKEIEELIAEEDRAREKRQKELHEEWERNVYRAIQEQVEGQLENLSTAELEARRRTVVEQFLAKSKTRAGTFLNIINPEEYNPFDAQASQIKYTLDQSRDPLLRELTKSVAEEAELSESGGGSPVRKARTKEMYDVTGWRSDVHRSTVWGHFFDDEGSPINLNGHPSRNRSQVVIDHDHAIYGKEIVDQELPKGKKLLPEARERRGVVAIPRGKAMVPPRQE
ncbi:hypothetical protein KFL_005770070 [Klebsormidium nitens]|uniref:Uncharacterized protein n=1 Tax=Klebsormidium nitens TaxID=105231 RepID=A0A1Y1IGE3_KLENI|nr:hypothetical protein KFL_005770070 [Klebsormidium nitens]|eukprot:GAQ89920.1 hypothetical protein KFL_005770070 [Klebsormidium nitens]